jgi:hypothetical protein
MEISGTNLSMTRGDSEEITVRVTDADGDPIVLATGDTIYFSVKECVADEDYALQKVVTAFEVDGSAIIEIEPADTADLEFKRYIYDIQWTDANGRVTTIVKASAFEIAKEVTV